MLVFSSPTATTFPRHLHLGVIVRKKEERSWNRHSLSHAGDAKVGITKLLKKKRGKTPFNLQIVAGKCSARLSSF